MSRPPLRSLHPSPRGVSTDPRGSRYFGLRFAELVALAETLARDRHGVEIPAKDRGLARTLLELPALFAHILGEHQSHYAAEAHLATAQQRNSLIAHVRRLAYEPDQGTAATGLAAFTVREGLTGTLPARFALMSAPKGEAKSQTYETLEDASLDAAWNRLIPATAEVPTPVVFQDDLVTLPLAQVHGRDVGETVILAGQGKAAVCRVEDPLDGRQIALRRLSQDPQATGSWPAWSATDPYVILVAPDLEARVFGWNADPVAFPPAELSSTDGYTAPTTAGSVRHGYQVTPSTGSYTPGSALLLSEAVDTPAEGDLLAILASSGNRAHLAGSAQEATVSFFRGERIALPTPSTDGADDLTRGVLERIAAAAPPTQLVEQSISARSTMLPTETLAGTAETWSPIPLDARVLGAWTETIAVAPTVPNPAPMTATVEVSADLAAMEPGRRVIVERLSDGFAAEARVVRLEALTGDIWRMMLGFDGGESAGLWSLGDVQIRGNAVRVSHGETRVEEIGSSDGVTPHQGFALKSSGLTRLVGADGSAPELEVRVNGVLWDLAPDFFGTTAASRTYIATSDADQAVTVSFGDGDRGAVPPAGRRNIAATYRVGLGQGGNIEAGRLGRIKKSSPLIDAVENPLAVDGGTDPADPAELRRQATRPIVTFGRAVSVQDHADLALLFPGIARTAARWLDRGQVELVAADDKGDPPADRAALVAWLDARRDPAVPLVLLDPQPVDVRLHLRIEHDAAYLPDAVRRTVTDALILSEPEAPGLFTFPGRAFSAPQSLSGVYLRLLDLPGVTGARALVYQIAPTTGVADILHATERQWLRLLGPNLTLDIVGPGTLIPDVEEGGA